MFGFGKLDWSDYPNFSADEFACSHCGENKITKELLDQLQKLRTDLDFSFVITSGYRCPEHPVEIKKDTSGTHTQGIAVDILCRGDKAYKIITNASNYGFTGIGVKQKGNNRFIHLDIASLNNGKVRPTVWNY